MENLTNDAHGTAYAAVDDKRIEWEDREGGEEGGKASAYNAHSGNRRGIAFGTRIAKADTALLNQQATEASALPTN